MDNEHSDNTALTQHLIWLAWPLALIALFWLFASLLEQQENPNQEVKSYQQQGHAVVVLKQNQAGHYVANGFINQQAVTFLLDTGATQVAVPSRLASSLGLKAGSEISVQTANGTSIAYQTTIKELQLGQIRLYNVAATIAPNYHSEHVLLGMSALKTLEFSQRDRQLTIRQ